MNRLTRTSKVILVLAVAAVLQGGILARNYAMRPQPLEVGDRFAAVEMEHAGVPVAVELSRLPDCTHVLFVIPTCDMCRRLAPRWAGEFHDPDHPRTVVVSYSDYEPALEYLEGAGLAGLPLFATGEETAAEIGRQMGVLTIPTLAVMRNGRVAAMGIGPDYTLPDLARQAQCPIGPQAS